MNAISAVAAKRGSDQRFVLGLAAALLVLIVLVSIFSPNPMDNDPSPTTYNSGSAGIKAAFLMLQELGYHAERWDEGPEALRSQDAAKTTLILASPIIPETQQAEVKAALADFLARGGRVLVTNVSGAYLLPGGETRAPENVFRALCYTTPEGQGELARTGSVAMSDTAAWAETSPRTRVEQWCGKDAVVVSYRVGAGEAIWWSSPAPLTNRALKNDASLKLVLASVGDPGRRVLFDEYLHGAEVSIWDTTKGLPVKPLAVQAGVVALLLVLSFGRRNGPLRIPVHAIRSSPLEFAESMGHLYQKAGATQVAIDGARRRLMRFLHERCGVAKDVMSRSPETIVDALQARMGGDWTKLEGHLAQAGEAEHATLSPSSALGLVKALDEDVQRLNERISRTHQSGNEPQRGSEASERSERHGAGQPKSKRGVAAL